MLKVNSVFSGFSVDDLVKTKKFYTDVLGLGAEEDEMGLHLILPSGGAVYVYQKDNHKPATYTVLNFEVDDIDDAMTDLLNSGVIFEHYEGLTDDKGVAHGISRNQGPDIAWFKDPAGNIMSVMQNSK